MKTKKGIALQNSFPVWRTVQQIGIIFFAKGEKIG